MLSKADIRLVNSNGQKGSQVAVRWPRVNFIPWTAGIGHLWTFEIAD